MLERDTVFPLGLPDSSVNRLVATAKAVIIEGDLATGNFEPYSSTTHLII